MAAANAPAILRVWAVPCLQEFLSNNHLRWALTVALIQLWYLALPLDTPAELISTSASNLA
jgi:hypothetical protein